MSVSFYILDGACLYMPFSMGLSRVIKWVCWPIHTHTNPWGRLKWPYAVIKLTDHLKCGLALDLMIFKLRKSMVIHDTKCPCWDQVSLNNPNPSPNLFLCISDFHNSHMATQSPCKDHNSHLLSRDCLSLDECLIWWSGSCENIYVS